MVLVNSMKTVFMMHKTKDVYKPFGDIYHFDRGPNRRPDVVNTKVPIQRNVWSFVVEAVLEYCRITFDLFSDSRPISVISVDSEEKILSLWYEEDQSLEAVWKAFSTEGNSVASVDLDYPGMPGLYSCKNVLHMPTPYQTQWPDTGNVGCVLIIGSDMRAKLSNWLPILIEQLQNPPQETGYLPIDSTEWIFIDLDLSSSTDENVVENELLSTEKHTMLYQRVPVKNNRSVLRALMRLAERKLGMASTLVQEIPMKEETNADAVSTMYGVELLHESKAHDFLQHLGLAERLYLRQEADKTMFQEPSSGFSKTLGIKWISPRPVDNLLIRYSVGAFRVTMAAVNTRSSVCLSQFVLGGRCVVLAHNLYRCSTSPEGPQTSADAFLLLCHGSVMYLHVLASPAPLSHPPILPALPVHQLEIPETDFRVIDFVKNFLLPARLAPASANSAYSIAPKIRALQLVERGTRYWPLRNDATLIGGNELAAPLFEHMTKDFFEVAESAACEKAVDSILATIKAHPVPKETGSSHLLCSQPVAMAVELEFLLSQYADISEDHSQLMATFKKKAEVVVFANKRLSKLIPKAKNLLINGHPIPGSPLSLLSEVKHQLRAKSGGMSKPGAVTSLPDNETVFGNGTALNIVFAPCPMEIFMQQLTGASKQSIPSRAEFEGVLAGGNLKGPLRLYAGLTGGGNEN
ncbi:cell cycle regulator mat89bb [Echinococcus multilocularis]|uniref:Cell cycle regulator mat89bb n=1 Tax=Echinococcus multilocularis TaxID=6211 RepID=A0A068YIA9_ECHMU|nr:cell cycle regulator mat89bb [Echinococcus multilocularis]